MYTIIQSTVNSMLNKILPLTLTIFLILIIVSSRISDGRGRRVVRSGGHTDETTDLDGFDCANGKIIPKFQLCNLVDDCGDGSDEDENKYKKLCSSDPSKDECINQLCYLNSTIVEGSGGVVICTNLSTKDECKRIHQSKVSGAFYCRIGECVPLNVTCYSRSDCMVTGIKAICQKISGINDTTPKNVTETFEDKSEGNGFSWGLVAIQYSILIVVLVVLGWRYIFCSPRSSYARSVKESLNIVDPVNCPYRWVLKSGGSVHNNAVSAGKDGGSDTYVIRASFKNEKVPGKNHNGRVLIPYKGKEVVIRGGFRCGGGLGRCRALPRMGYYEVLTDPDNVLEWIPCCRLGGIPANAVVGGGYQKTPQSDSGIYYIGRFEHNGAVTCGKVYNRKCYISYGWKEISSDTYYILVVKPISDKLEEVRHRHQAQPTIEPKTKPTTEPTTSTHLLGNKKVAAKKNDKRV